jgi:hypothetical protein
MRDTLKENPWVWVVVQDPGKTEQFLGQQYGDSGEMFIPAFLEKEEAEKGLSLLTKEAGHTYEVQAIRYDDLKGRASEGGFAVFVLDAVGTILEKVKT